MKSHLAALLLISLSPACSLAQKMPLVYQVENTGADVPAPVMRSFNDLPTITSLPDPFRWADSSARLVYYSDWRRRRAEISAQVQHYLLGKKPLPPDSLTASFAGNTLTVTVYVGGKSLTLTANITRPAGTGPFPAVIGMGSGTGSLPSDIFTSRGVATIAYNYSQLGPWTQDGRGMGDFYTLFPDPNVGYFTAWAWGISRIIDGLYKVPEANIDLMHLGVTGCSFAGKMALYAGALDERIALTIAQEPGGGGDATWRFSQTIGPSVEILTNAQSYGWYSSTVSQFNSAVTKLPFDQHEVMALIAPRALLVLGNPDYVWLSDESGFVGCVAASSAWIGLRISDRFGFSKVGGHSHCALPDVQRPDVIAFVQKFLLGDSTANTTISTSPWSTDLTPWIPWGMYRLTNDLTSAVNGGEELGGYKLEQNYPNPFNPSTTVRFALLHRSHVELNIYDTLGRVVSRLIDEERDSGSHEVVWNGISGSGEPVASGVYVCRIKADGFVSSQKMICLR
jgi:hypothetical protein